MRHVRAALARIAGVFAGRSAEDDLRDELHSHIELETAENIRRGMPPEEARRRGLLASGGLTPSSSARRASRCSGDGRSLRPMVPRPPES